MNESTTHTMKVPGAGLTYDLRRNGASKEPVLLMIGQPNPQSSSQRAAS